MFYFVLLGVICALLGFVFLKAHAALVLVQRRTRTLIVRRMAQSARPPLLDAELAAELAATDDSGAGKGAAPASAASVDADDDDADDEAANSAGCCEPLLMRIAESRVAPLFVSNYTFALLVAAALAFFSFPGLIGRFMAKPGM